MTALSPRLWTREELEGLRARAETLFKEERRKEGPRAFADLYSAFEPVVREAMQLTDDCRAITGTILAEHPLLWVTLRYFCAPPISEEDLWTLVGKKFKRVQAEFADEGAEALVDVLDEIRLPWLSANRAPTQTEREAAILATAQLVTYERLRTARRGQAANVQETYVASELQRIGFQLNSSRAAITSLDDLERRTFSRERKLWREKCDLPVRLSDGRMLALECKVSNGPKNGWKRLNRDVVGKAKVWNSAFGEQVITGAVVAGSFDLSCLVKAQQQGVALFWQQDVSSLLEFVENARKV